MARRAALACCIALGGSATLAACGDLFHRTDWGATCQGESCIGNGAAGSGAPGSGGAGGGPGSGGSGGEGATGPCTPGDLATCFEGPDDAENVGACVAGERTCDEAGSWGECEGQVLPADEETCDDAADADCDGETSNGCTFASCSALPPGSPSGTYPIDPDGTGQASQLTLYCDVQADGTGWALLANSIGGPATLPFWQFGYAERLDQKGTASPTSNYYLGRLYTYGLEYRDEVEDLAGAVVTAAQVTVGGFDPATFAFTAPVLVSGSEDVFTAHFASGWSASDFDADTYVDNCAAIYAGVAQHYSGCWVLNFGADADEPFADGDWGPHGSTAALTGLGLTGDGSDYSRLARYTRWVRW